MLIPFPILVLGSVIGKTSSFRPGALLQNHHANSFLTFAARRLSIHRPTRISPYGTHQRVSRRPSPSLWATVASQESYGTSQPTGVNNCQICKRSFHSRNALFRHLRGEDATDYDCHLEARKMGMKGSLSSLDKDMSLTAVLRYGYLVHNHADSPSKHNETSTDIRNNVGYNEIVANTIHEAFLNLTASFFEEEKTNSVTLSTSALTYSTAAKLRQPSLRQDDQVMAAASEVLSFNYRLCIPHSIGNAMGLAKKWKDYASNDQLLQDIQSFLDARTVNDPIQIQLHAMDAMLPRSFKFYAERGCSQRSYRYLLPLRWINFEHTSSVDETNHLIEWLRGVTSTSLSERKHQPRGAAASTSAPRCIMKLKQALKAAESRTVPNRRTRRQQAALNSIRDTDDDERDNGIDIDQSSDGDLDSCGERNEDLRGMAASPSHDATWRTIDKANIVGFFSPTQTKILLSENAQFDDLHDIHVILEFRGDGFLLGQIPRLISTLVAMANDWLPIIFFDVATRPDVYITAPPMAPFLDAMMYYHSPRYHFHELVAKSSDSSSETDNIDRKMFDYCISGSSKEYEWEKELRTLLLHSSSIDPKSELQWLSDLRDKISPSIREDMDTVSKNMVEFTLSQTENINKANNLPVMLTDSPAGAYSGTLELLRGIVSNQRWPATSSARSRVIMSSPSAVSTDKILATKKGSVVTAFPGNADSSGSFTVINMNIWNEDSGIPLPAANKLFPELARSVFELEKEIIEKQVPIPMAKGMSRDGQSFFRRLPSTHCAVNRNAQFTPHVDSGRGFGQNVSMIVGLGNYTGGEIIVEGVSYPIRYHALEFDGWKQLHWTSPFVGERYSLVWFTPEQTPEQRQSHAQLSDASGKEDIFASQLAQVHSAKTPFFPPLNYRPNSTDALVIGEILDSEKGCAYTMECNKAPNMPDGFSLKGHSTVLDIGAHIGVFSRYAIGEGCSHIIAFEPEASNFDLLSRNLRPENSIDCNCTIKLHSSAVAAGHDNRILIRARDQNDGKQNTWRHSLSEYSQYVDRTTKLPSDSQKGMLDRVEVRSVPFFSQPNESGDHSDGALVPGVTFVKLDCEGAEIEILLSPDASKHSSWLDVTHLVVEWSFTKERRVDIFHRMLANLETAGFEVYYEGMGSWWDTDSHVMWPYPDDILVFAIMSK
eukprot:CCRYP_012212-RA/>CCRYP_012212-RA protein AED:0.33 eAED:0.33 QI:0/0.33/0.5/1/0.33/0.5/4/647/1166